MKMVTKFTLIGVLFFVVLLIACDGGNDVESNLDKVSEVAFTEEEIQDENVAEGSREVEPIGVYEETVSNNEEEVVNEEEVAKEVISADEADSNKAKLQKFFGRWETEEQKSEDMIILEMGKEQADDTNNSKDAFEYIRFGYEASGFFPMEKIIELEEHGSKNAYYITISYMEENHENAGWSVVETEEVTTYLIELVEEDKMLLTYTDDEINREFYFHKK